MEYGKLSWHVHHFLLGLCFLVIIVDGRAPDNVFDEATRRQEYGCYAPGAPRVNISCLGNDDTVVLIDQLLYGKRENAAENSTECSIDDRHPCTERFSVAQLKEYYHQCSASAKCDPTTVWGLFLTQECMNLTNSNFIFVDYYCFSDTTNVAVTEEVSCQQKDDIFLRYKRTGTTGGTYACVAETSGSSDLVVHAIDLRLNQTTESDTGIGDCSDTDPHSLTISDGDAANVASFDCTHNRFLFDEVYRTSNKRLEVKLVVANGFSLQSVWLLVKSGSESDVLYVSCGPDVTLQSTEICHPTTTASPTTSTSVTSGTTETSTSTTESAHVTTKEPDPHTSTNKQDRTGIIAGAVVAGVFAIAVVALMIWCALRRRKDKKEPEVKPGGFVANGSLLVVPAAVIGPPPQKLKVPALKRANIIELDDDNQPIKDTSANLAKSKKGGDDKKEIINPKSTKTDRSGVTNIPQSSHKSTLSNSVPKAEVPVHDVQPVMSDKVKADSPTTDSAKPAKDFRYEVERDDSGEPVLRLHRNDSPNVDGKSAEHEIRPEFVEKLYEDGKDDSPRTASANAPKDDFRYEVEHNESGAPALRLYRNDAPNLADKAKVVDNTNIYARVKRTSSKKSPESPRDISKDLKQSDVVQPVVTSKSKEPVPKSSKHVTAVPPRAPDARRDAEIAETLRDFDAAVNEEKARSQWVSMKVEDPAVKKPGATVNITKQPDSRTKGKFVSKISV